MSDGDRTVRLKCFNCRGTWLVELREGERIGPYGRMSDGHVHDYDVVCRNKHGFGTYRAVSCPTCNMEGPHTVRSSTGVAE